MENRKRVKVIHHKSAIPVYGAALVFLLWGLISPIYRLWAIALACITSAGAYLGLKLAFPGRDETVVEALLTGDRLPALSQKIVSVNDLDGRKLIFQDGWLIARFSGTEPRIRIFCEMPSLEQAEQLCLQMRDYLGLK